MTGWQESYRKKGWVGAYPYWVPFLLFVLVLSPTPGMPRLERHGAPFCQDFGSDWWSSHVIKDGSPGIQGFWWGLQQGWTQTGEAVNILEGPRAQVSSRHKQMQASLCLASCAGVLSASLLPLHSFLFFLSLYPSSDLSIHLSPYTHLGDEIINICYFAFGNSYSVSSDTHGSWMS